MGSPAYEEPVDRVEDAVTCAGLLVAWGNAWLANRVAFDEVLTHVQGGDDSHLVVGLPCDSGSSDADRPVPLGWALSELRRRSGAADARPTLRLAIPVPGDANLPCLETGLADALAAGAAVVAPGLLLVPGSRAVWTAHAIAGLGDGPAQAHIAGADLPYPRPSGAAVAPADIREADRALTAALTEAIDDLDGLDLAAATRPDRARRHEPARSLPPGHDPLAVRLLTRADALAAALATADAGAAMAVHSGSQHRLLTDSLRPLRAAVRRAREISYGPVQAHPGAR